MTEIYSSPCYDICDADKFQGADFLIHLLSSKLLNGGMADPILYAGVSGRSISWSPQRMFHLFDRCKLFKYIRARSIENESNPWADGLRKASS